MYECGPSQNHAELARVVGVVVEFTGAVLLCEAGVVTGGKAHNPIPIFAPHVKSELVYENQSSGRKR